MFIFSIIALLIFNHQLYPYTSAERITFSTQLLQTFHTTSQNSPSPHPLLDSTKESTFSTFGVSKTPSVHSSLFNLPQNPKVQILSRASTFLHTSPSSSSAASHPSKSHQQSNFSTFSAQHDDAEELRDPQDSFTTFHRLSLYESFLKSQHAHERQIMKTYSEYTQQVKSMQTLQINEQKGKKINGDVTLQDGQVQVDDINIELPQPPHIPRHRTLRHFTQLNVENNPLIKNLKNNQNSKNFQSDFNIGGTNSQNSLFEIFQGNFRSQNQQQNAQFDQIGYSPSRLLDRYVFNEKFFILF